MHAMRRARDRGHTDLGWLDSRHSFSFGHYRDPAHMGYGPLRVINDDRVQGGGGFATHAHADMEIISYVIEGVLAHRDSLGTGSVIQPGDVQRMSAGTGIRHSEFNASADEPVHFLQIWIEPERRGLAPGYEQKTFSTESKRGRLRLIGSQDGRDGSVRIHQDVHAYASVLITGERIEYALGPDRIGWVQVARGTAVLNGHALEAGDGVALRAGSTLELEGAAVGELLLFDMKAG